MKPVIKLLGINLSIFFIFLISPAIILEIYGYTKSRIINSLNLSKDYRAFYPTYSDKDYSVKLLNEFKNFSTEYKSYVGWKMNNAKFDYVEVHGPYNSRRSFGEKIDESVWFFGGSTMWGHGASNLKTIPSQFSSITDLSVYNFGNIGWDTRQSLNQLITTLGDQHKPSVIIFYDGVNDVITQCRSEVKYIPAHSREKYLQDIMSSEDSSFTKKVVRFIFNPYKSFANKLKLSNNSTKTLQYDCHINQNKAKSIAQHFVNNWHTAFSIATQNEIPFYGILQPNLFTTNTNSDYMIQKHKKINPIYRKQFKVVYPLIMKEIKKECSENIDFCASITDGTNWLGNTKNIFLDFCHLNSQGNNIIANKLADLIR